jgi:hypothetical protein
MSEHRDEWARWGETWRGGTNTIMAVDIEALRARLRRAQRVAMLVVASEVVVTVGALWFAFRLLRSDDPGEQMVGIAVAVFVIIVAGLALWARRGSFEGAGGAVIETLELAIRRCETRARVFTATYGAAATAVAFLGALVVLHAPGSASEVALPVGVAVAALIAVVGITLWRDRCNRAELAQLRTICEAMREKPGEADDRSRG